MNFAEPIPPQCPPHNAIDSELNNVCRFLNFAPSDPQNFYSHVKLGKSIGNAGLCRGRSISLMRNKSKKFIAAKKLPFFKDLKVAVLNIPMGSGLNVEDGQGHIDFWPYARTVFSGLTTSIANSAEDV